MESNERPFELREKEYDVEANRLDDFEKETKLENDEKRGNDNNQTALPASGNDGVDKDFPDLAPSKSAEFPDGTCPNIPPLIGRGNRSMVDGCWWIFVSILFFWYTFILP
jgi:hypothetical protein